MSLTSIRPVWPALFVALSLTAAAAEIHTITITTPKPPQTEGFKMGRSQSPDGSTITVDGYSLRLNSKPWTPVMGEFHYSRYPENEWREEMLKMKAGGIDIIATYVFWIHHEEIEGEFDWSGSRNLRRFIELCHNVGLKAIVRCGPWCHGEVRNGGLPDWILQKGWRTRSDDPNYLEKVRMLYGEIAGQLKGLLWKDAGPVIGIQLENEYSGAAEHLLNLKRIARSAGLDVPLYTRTGWPELRTPIPFGEILPLFGVYAEGFWDRQITPMPGNYWDGFHFTAMRSDSAIATDQLGRRKARDEAGVNQYPYLTCEIGGGMMNSYHRRILIYPADIESTTLVKLGSGSTLPGYYMYHGGVNPEGKLTTLMESQATNYWNDMPVKNYDFQAPLGQYGQIRPHYHLLRRLHLFTSQWDSSLAGMSTFMPDRRPAGRNDTTTLRWAVRSNGDNGLVFVNNYQRLQPMPDKQDVRFALNLPSGSLTFPDEPVTIPAESRFFWPFNFDLGSGLRLAWATVQPVCAIEDGNICTVFFAETPGIPAKLAFDQNESAIEVFSGHPKRNDAHLVISDIKPGTNPAVQLRRPDGGIIRIVVLDETNSLALWKGTWQAQVRIFLTRAGLITDGDSLQLTSSEPQELTVGICPAPTEVRVDSKILAGQEDGVFRRYTPDVLPGMAFEAEIESVKPAGPARTIPIGKIANPVAEAPVDADFKQAAVWRIRLPSNLDLEKDPILRIHYIGDVARVMLNDRLVTDDFYNGRPFEIGLRRHAPEILNGQLCIAILPLRKDAPIYMAKEAQPDFGRSQNFVSLKRVEIIPRYHVQLDK